jgi:hypothetical protein
MHEYILQEKGYTFHAYGWYIFAHSRMPQPFSTDILLSGSVSIPVHLEPDMLPQKSGSRQLPGSCLQHRTSSDIDDGAEISVRELHAFLLTRDTHRCKESSNARPQCHLQLCDVSVHFHRRGDPLPSFHLDLLKRAPQLIPEIFGF